MFWFKVAATHFLLVIHSPVTEGGGLGWERNKEHRIETYILLLLPVPRSIMMCLFLKYAKSKIRSFAQEGTSHSPVEEHDRARVIQLVHLPPRTYQHPVLRAPALDLVIRTLLKSGTSVMSTR